MCQPDLIMNTSISVICYTSKTLANGEHPLMLRVIKNRKRTMKSLGICVNQDHWDFTKNEPKASCPNKEHILQIILDTKAKYQKMLLEKRINGEEFTSDSLIKDSTKQKKNYSVEDFYQSIISDLRNNGKIGNSYAYLNSYNSLKSFNNSKKLNFTFNYIDTNFLKRYEDWLRKRNIKETTISYNFRTLRAAFNRAIDEKLIKREKSPFTEFKISKFNTKTIKRALSKKEILKVIKYDSTGKSDIRKLAHDLFCFSYLCCGISFVDISNLTKDNLTNNRLIYKRQKTNGSINFPISKEAIKLINKYKEYCKDATYLFPILHTDIHKTPMQKSNRVHKVCHNVNRELRLIGKELKITSELTTYVARHSFATILKNSGVNIALISEALGHSELSTTQIYLDSFENSQVKEAMKHLL